MNRGFTVVEVVVTLTVVVILLGLGTVSLRSSLANGRDSERAADVESIARGLEQRYTNGNIRIALPTSPSGDWPDSQGYGKGYYPGVNELLHMQGQTQTGFNPTAISGGYTYQNLPGTSEQIVTSPSNVVLSAVCTSSCQPAGTNTQLATAFSTNRDKYVYEPIDAAGNVCLNGACIAYNLYWTSEVDSTVYKTVTGLKEVKSKRR